MSSAESLVLIIGIFAIGILLMALIAGGIFDWLRRWWWRRRRR